MSVSEAKPFLKSLKMSNEIAAGEHICNRGSLVSGWVCGLLLLFFLPRPSSLPPPAFQTPLVPPRAISILDSWVGGLLVWQAARQNLFFKITGNVKRDCRRRAHSQSWRVCGLLLLFFLSRPSSLPPPAFQAPLVPPRAQSPFLTLGRVGSWFGRQRGNTFF